MDERPRRRVPRVTFLLVPLMAALMVPLAVIFALVFYGLGIWRSLRNLIAYLLSSRPRPRNPVLARPHVLEARVHVAHDSGE